MNLFKKPDPQKPLVLVGPGLPEVLSRVHEQGYQVREAWSTRGVLDALAEGASLAILDPVSLQDSAGLSTQVLQETLDAHSQNGLSVVSPSQFLEHGQQILSQAPTPRRPLPGVRFLPPRVALFTNYAGGTGKTTLSICSARLFQQRSGLPCALIEIGLGSSACQARLGEKLPSLFSLVTQNQPAGKWEGIDIYPLGGREAQVLSNEPRLLEHLNQISQTHTLTVLDVHPASPLWPAALSLASDIFVVTVPRLDCLAQTAVLLREIDELTQPMEQRPRRHLVLNMTRTLGEKLQLLSQAAANLPFDAGRADRFEGSLASPLLNLLYPSWSTTGKGIRL